MRIVGLLLLALLPACFNTCNFDPCPGHAVPPGSFLASSDCDCPPVS